MTRNELQQQACNALATGANMSQLQAQQANAFDGRMGGIVQYTGGLTYMGPNGVTPLSSPIKNQTTNPPKQEKSMFKEVRDDLKKFARENKSTIYLILGLIVLDRAYFNGAFEKKLRELAQRFVGLVEAKLDKIAPGVSNEKRDA